jgi:endonuclease I
MKRLFASLLWLAGLPLASLAQTIPAVPAPAPATLQGEALRTWLHDNWYTGKRAVLSYDNARGRMYNYVDNFNNKVVCVYSGYSENVTYSATSTNTGVVSDINCEHTIPQSWFDENTEQRSDLHHLYPAKVKWNSDRGSDPFADIPDATTLGWLRGTVRLTTIPTSNIEEYSEDTNSQFEPREDHKGNLARTAFYFYTMHAGAKFDAGKNVITALANLQTLYQWHLADPVDEHERIRNQRVASVQGNYNPYINDPALVARAWGFTPAGPVISFSAATGTIAEGNTGTSTYTATVNVSPAPTAALTVQVAVDAANSTATSGTDFTFTSPQTVTFAAGQTSATVTVNVVGDTQAEANETLTLTLQNAGTDASIGGPASQTLTITNDDGTPPSVSFATAAGTIVEGNSDTQTYTVQVNFTGTLPAGGFTVPVIVETSGTATATTDYTLSTATLTFSGTTTQQAVTVLVNGDLAPEANETVRLRLGTPSDATVVLGTTSIHVLTITNDDQAPVGASCQDLYFSEYVESGPGSGINTKVLEIYNPTNSPVDLAGKRVELFANGATTATSKQELSGTLAPGRVFLVANTQVTDPSVKALNPLESAVGFFNGDDAIVLFDGTDTLDIIGVVGQRPAATGWDVPGGTTTDNTLRRLPATGRGNTRWSGATGAAATWQAAGINTYSDLGKYTSTACLVATATRASATLGGLELYPNPTSESLRLRLPGTAGVHAATIELLDGLGRVVRSRSATLSNTDAAQLDLRGLPAGLYAVRVRTAAGQYAGRVVVQ